MRVYWLNGSLTIEQETEKETALIHELISAAKYEPPLYQTIGSGETVSGSELSLEAVIGGNQGSPSVRPVTSAITLR